MGILIKNGLIIDGRGVSGIEADILIQDDKISEISPNIKENGHHIIDARGKIVSPGFIDIHNHADLTILETNMAEAYVGQGITNITVYDDGFTSLSFVLLPT
ncbi:MAG: hypothetical protein ACTSV5_12475 [Promethearchaeota archaeon]